MTHCCDYYAHLAKNRCQPRRLNKCGLAAGFVDECTVSTQRDKNKARQKYMEGVAKTPLKSDGFNNFIGFQPEITDLPLPDWIGFEIEFTLETPWHAKDDRPFHVLDNPVRKDRVFGVPFISAAAWKGLLRWACRMHHGLLAYFDKHGATMADWKDPSWIRHLFGNEKGAGQDLVAGALCFYPTWFDQVGFEVINPHSRAKRAGKKPIYYEVVPPDREGLFKLLYAPVPGEKSRPETLEKLIAALDSLLGTYGISAKRTAGWGRAKIGQCRGFQGRNESFTGNNIEEFREKIAGRFNPSGGGHD